MATVKMRNPRKIGGRNGGVKMLRVCSYFLRRVSCFVLLVLMTILSVASLLFWFFFVLRESSGDNNNNNISSLWGDMNMAKGESEWGHRAQPTPTPPTPQGIKVGAWDEDNDKGENMDVLSRNASDVLSALFFFFPPARRRAHLMQKLREVLSFGPRVAGAASSGREKMREFMLKEAQWRPPRAVLFGAGAAARLPTSHWQLEWDNFTSDTPLGERHFANLVFHFSGGSAFRRQSGSERWTAPRKRPSFAATSHGDVNMTNEKLRHVVLSAHWDSKYFADIKFLGACDAAVPVVYLLETMRIIAVLADTAQVFQETTANAGGEDVCRRLRDALSPDHRQILMYYYADGDGDDDVARCLSGKQGAGTSDGKAHDVSRVGGGWRRLLRLVDHLPAITVVFFDGEEAFVEWRGGDHTYGSRHLAQRWKTTAHAGAAPSRFDSVDLFVLYDLMGPAGTTFHNYFPDQSGRAFASLADVEAAHRARSLRRTAVSGGRGGKEADLPDLWSLHGPPHDLFTRRSGRNVFFPAAEKFARGPVLRAGLGVEDDHIHWMETRRVLHLIPWPFPSSWHTARDDGREIDGGTVADLFGILLEFTLRLGEGRVNALG